MKQKKKSKSNDLQHSTEHEEVLEPGQFKPRHEGINNTDVPGVPAFKKALNNPTRQDEGLSGGGSDPLADL